jgi:hypothetical protein
MFLSSIVRWLTGDTREAHVADDWLLLEEPPVFDTSDTLRAGVGDQVIAKVMVISDTHLMHKSLSHSAASSSDASADPDIDILIHCGDFLVHSSGRPAAIRDFFEWLASIPARHRVVIFGNHEKALDHGSRSVHHVEALLASLDLSDRIRLLHNTAISLPVRAGRSVKIYGSPHTADRGFIKRANAFALHAQHLQQVWAQIPDDTEILVTHSPPYGVLDEGRGQSRLGDPELLRWYHQRQAAGASLPLLHVFGHCHEGYGFCRTASTLLVNAAIAGYPRRPHLIDIFAPSAATPITTITPIDDEPIATSSSTED